MANARYVESLLGPLEPGIRKVLVNVFNHVLGNLRIGRATNRTRSENFQAYCYTGTTPSTANTEFTIAHGLGVTPYLCIPVLPLDETSGRLIRLEVTRVADASRVYLRSPEVDAPFSLLIEG